MLQLYTKEFYETVVKAKLNPGGVFVTQSGPAGVLSSTLVPSSLNRELGSNIGRKAVVSKHCVPFYAACCAYRLVRAGEAAMVPLSVCSPYAICGAEGRGIWLGCAGLCTH